MIKLNRTTEYGLIALRHISRKRISDPQGITSAREIADYYELPFEITAKTLQKLKERGFIHSAQGARGGYTLQRELEDITLAEFLESMEGPQSVVACVPFAGPGAPSPIFSKKPAIRTSSNDCECEYSGKCEIKGLMTGLNQKVFEFLAGIRLAEITVSPTTAWPRAVVASVSRGVT